MYYILIKTEDNRTLYQEVERGQVVRITDLDGNSVPSLTVGHGVLDANPPQPSWALPDRPIEPPPRNTILTRLQFRNLFTDSEKVAIYQLAESNIQVKIWLDDVTNSEFIELFSEQTVSGIQGLKLMGVLTQELVNEILNA